ncbi:MAG: hypothetical protein RSH78_04665 [Bacilli bacterium]
MIKNFLKKNKTKIIFFLGLIVLICSLGFFAYKIITKEKDVDLVIKEIAQKYYEEYYYPDLKARETFTAKIKELSKTGVKKTLWDITSKVDHEDKYRLLNPKVSGIYCKFYETMVVYYPKSPYTVKDYKMDLTIKCKEN